MKINDLSKFYEEMFWTFWFLVLAALLYSDGFHVWASLNAGFAVYNFIMAFVEDKNVKPRI